MSGGSYVLSSGRPELDRLRLQALVWEPDAEALFREIPVHPGWACLDVGCGAAGVLRPLSRAVGPAGSVLGIDVDPMLLSAAGEFVDENRLSNVSLARADVFASPLRDTFDLVHARFVFAPIGREDQLLSRCADLCRPGGVLVIEEPVASCWTLLPTSAAFDRLKAVILEAFEAGGGDFNAGHRTHAMLRAAGFENVNVRASVQALAHDHPYLRLPLQFATSLRARILESRILAEPELDALLREVEAAIAAPGVAGLTFAITQVWGTKPGEAPR